MDNSAVTMWIWAKVINVMIMEFLLGAKCVYENIKKMKSVYFSLYFR